MGLSAPVVVYRQDRRGGRTGRDLSLQPNSHARVVIPVKSIGRSDAFARICRYPACLGMRENFIGAHPVRNRVFHKGRPGGQFKFLAAVSYRRTGWRIQILRSRFIGAHPVRNRISGSPFIRTDRVAYSNPRRWYEKGEAMGRRIFGRRFEMDEGATAMKSPPCAVRAPAFELVKNTINYDKYMKRFMAQTTMVIYYNSCNCRVIIK